jgi:hypothetical protein
MCPEKAAKQSKVDSPTHGFLFTLTISSEWLWKTKAVPCWGASLVQRSMVSMSSSPPSITGHLGGKDPISLKKLECGDARWHHEKEILSFLVNGATKTVHISQTKANDIVMELRRILKKTKVQLKRYCRIVGKL